MITQNAVGTYLKNKTPFMANNIFACYDNEGNYTVYSYQTIILKVSVDGKIYFDSKY